MRGGPVKRTTTSFFAFLLSLLVASDAALATGRFVLATGRRDPRIYAIDFDAFLLPQNDRTPKAIVSRSKVQVERLDGTPLGDPANIVLSEDRGTAYVISHHGAVDNAEFLQHGGRGSVSVMDVASLLNPAFDDTDRALKQSFDSGYFGAVGLLVLPDLLLVSHSENWLTEDGLSRISLVDRRTGSRRGQIEMALGHPSHSCPAFPVPFVSPTPPPVVPFEAPDPQFGCWPNPEFLAIGKGSDGRSYLFSGNAGTDDVSVMDLQHALMGVRVVEVAPRIPVQTGPFGIKASPDGKLVAVTARESAKVDFEGNTISIVDVDLARMGAPNAEVARVQVGTDDSTAPARPFTVAWTPDGEEIVVANFRTNNVSIVDLRLALKDKRRAEVARIPVTRPDGLPGRPKGTAVTADGRFAVVSGGPRQAPTAPPSGTVWIIDLRKRAVVATVTGVGNDPYGLTILEAAP